MYIQTIFSLKTEVGFSMCRILLLRGFAFLALNISEHPRPQGYRAPAAPPHPTGPLGYWCPDLFTGQGVKAPAPGPPLRLLGLGWAVAEPGTPALRRSQLSQAVCRAKRPAVWSQCCQVTAGSDRVAVHRHLASPTLACTRGSAVWPTVSEPRVLAQPPPPPSCSQ